MLRTSERIQPTPIKPKGEAGTPVGIPMGAPTDISTDISAEIPAKAPVKSVPKGKKVFYALLFMLVLGMMYGSILLQSESEGMISGLETIQKTYIAEKNSQPVIRTFLNSVLSGSLFLFLTFFCGFHAFGQPFTFFLLFLKGLGIGSSIGYLYLHHGAAGIGYSLLLILPGAAFSTLALILSGRESVRLSNLLFSCFRKEKGRIKITWKLYLLKHLILLGFILLSAFLESITALLFAGLFQFG